MLAVPRSWPGQLDPSRHERQTRTAAGDWCGHSATPASAQPPPAGRSAAGTGQTPRPRRPAAPPLVRLAPSLLPRSSAHATATALPSRIVASRPHEDREHPHLRLVVIVLLKAFQDDLVCRHPTAPPSRVVQLTPNRDLAFSCEMGRVGGGDEGTRTPNPCLAKVLVLLQD